MRQRRGFQQVCRPPTGRSQCRTRAGTPSTVNATLRFAPQNAVYCRWKPKARRQADDPQSFWAWPGLKLIGAGGKIKRGVLTCVVSCTPDSVDQDCGVTLCLDQLVRCARPCHALTYAGCQGLTLPGRVRLETLSTHFTLRHLYVGCSRATSSVLLEVKKEMEFLHRFKQSVQRYKPTYEEIREKVGRNAKDGSLPPGYPGAPAPNVRKPKKPFPKPARP